MPRENVDIALEPEAAIFASNDDLQHVHASCGHPAKLRVMVVDCGGGTVDVKVMDIDMVTEEYHDVRMADGGPWGGTVVDKNIKRKISEFIGEEVAGRISAFNWLVFEREAIEKDKKQAVSTHETIFHLTREMTAAIHQAGGDLQESCRAQRVPGIRYRRRLNCLVFDKEVTDECFEESIRSIDQHIDGILRQVESRIHCALMVGGFANSPILLHRIKGLLDDGPHDCRLIHPDRADMAVVRGAVLHGQKPRMVRSRISRYTYGVRTHTRFVPGRHNEEKKVLVEGRERCKDIFDVYVQKGERIHADRPVQIKPYHPLTEKQTTVRFVLFKSTNVSPKYTDEAECEELTTLRVSSPNVELGRSRTLDVKIDFSDTTLRFRAVDRSSNNSARDRVPFERC